MIYGRSGNQSAVFPLEASGINVGPLHTCQFSAHTAYPTLRGTRLSSSDFLDLIEGLRLNNLLPLYTHLLTGYIADPSIANEIATLRSSLGDQIEYFCDPVLGDRGRMYVRPETLEPIKTKLLVNADTITPNAYEVTWLTGQTLRNQAELRSAVAILHSLGPKNVVVSSTEWNHRITFFSWEQGAVQLAIETPTISRAFDGPGDVFTALLLANSIKFPGQFKVIAERTVNSVFAVLERTDKMGSRELELPEALNDIVAPPERFKVMTMEEFDRLEIVDQTIGEKMKVNDVGVEE